MVFSPARSVLVGGSRALSPVGRAAAHSLGFALAQSEFPLVVGCAEGADSEALTGFLSCQNTAPWLSVFAVGGPAGGFPGCSGVRPAVAAAAAAGASVSWWAGGPASVPMRARLAARSRAAVKAAALAAVFVLGQPESRGSLLAAGFAAQQGLPVFVICIEFEAELLQTPLEGCAGSWAPSRLFGHPCVKWSPEQPQL